MIPRRGDMVVTRWGARFLGRRFPCAIGRGGIVAAKREGDGGTPAGSWQLVSTMVRMDRPDTVTMPLPSLAIGPRDIWSDDIRDDAYNRHVRGPSHPYSHERLRRADPLYDLVLVSDWNYPDAVPGHGSAIFVHQWRRPRYPTEGCIAFRRDHLRWIAARWTPRSRIIVRG